MSLQLTSGSGGRTFHEAALRLNQEVENLTLLSYSYSITGISKPADKVECTKQMHLKLSANLIIREAAAQLEAQHAYMCEAQKRSRQRMYDEAATGDPEAVARYEHYLQMRRESYQKKKEEVSA